MSIEKAERWRRYLSGWKLAPPDIIEPTTWIETYLTIRNSRKMNAENKDFFKSLLKMSLPENMPKTFYTEWHDTLGYWLADRGEYKLAEQAYKNAESHSKSGSKSYYQMLARKMIFFYNKSNTL